MHVAIGLYMSPTEQEERNSRREIRYDEMTGQPYQKTIPGKKSYKFRGVWMEDIGYPPEDSDLTLFVVDCEHKLLGIKILTIDEHHYFSRRPEDYFNDVVEPSLSQHKRLAEEKIREFYPQLHFTSEEIKLYTTGIYPGYEDES